MKLITASILATALLAGCGSYSPMSRTTSAPMADTPTRTADGVLVGPNGMTLYTFGRDVVGSGKSVCNGPCITNWPALTAPPAARTMGDYSVVVRDDGARQWAYKGAPLYYWAKDAKAGDRTGDGVGGVWKVARP
ncbi:ATP-binding protein [Comamonadaceae bacterium OTU4NAUVB1]|jgi:predicted lipoprotein with Yx(FWY)xxD motif|nr:ATP-binding protein [Comamonadaceae bacterium OTU4NAUVB1]HSU21596.1 ATP-binding protein [Variovorax sp.]